MNQNIINYYENYKEEDRLTTNNARKIEFLTTIHFFEKHFHGKLKILDCAAGTGTYAFYLADRGHQLTATDITPRHIAYMNEMLKTKLYQVETKVLDAVDMSCFPDESFDVVLNMGPFYHLIDRELRKRCFEESLRVLKRGGYLAVAYIPRLYINQMIVMSDHKYLDGKLLKDYRGVCPVQMVWQHPETVVDPLLRLKTTLDEAGHVEQRLLDHLHIEEEWLDRYPSELSGGELQRFCLVRALRPEVKFLLCDEISAMLDLVTQAQIWNFLLEEARRRDLGMLIVSHDDALLRQVCTRVETLPFETGGDNP